TASFSTQPAGASAGAPFGTQPVVHVVDAAGNAVSGQSVSLSKFSGPGTLIGCNTPTTDASGNATFAGCEIDTAGSYVLTATAGAATVNSSSFTVASGAPATATFSTQPGTTSATGGTAFSPQAVVHVVDAFSNPVSGQSVSLSKFSGPG